MIGFVNAKINIGLNITSKRQDGYHELETLFYPVGKYNGTPANPEPFCDVLEIHPCEHLREDEFIFSGNPIDCPLEKNLVYKAVRLWRGKITDGVAARIFLDKHLPDGAGLGGGSADASFTLRILNELAGNPFSKNELVSFAATLGADCPFFIENRPVVATGIGEIMKPVDLDLSGKWVVIVKPDVYISTKEAFSGIKPQKPTHKISDIVRLPIEEWERAGLKNDFEPHIFKMYPELHNIKRELKASGALYESMSGSGSSIYGIFRDEETAFPAFKRFEQQKETGLQTYLIKL